MGVREYFIFDPLEGSLSPQLRGFRLEGGDYMPLPGTPLHSEVLDLNLVIEAGRLRLYQPQAGERLRVHAEAEADRRAAEAVLRAAEQDNARLRHELQGLRATR